MTAKDKAMELIRKFSSKLPYYSEKDNLTKSKQCALIVVDEIIEVIKPHLNIIYWQEVKQEIVLWKEDKIED